MNSNELPWFPNSVGIFTFLSQDDFPVAVETMTSLTWLKANKTQLKNVPESITKLNKLEDLILSRNEIAELPQEITDMSGIC